MSDPVHKVLERFKSDPSLKSCVSGWKTIPAVSARTVPFPADITDSIRQALASRGITTLYTHQKDAYDAAMAGEDFVVVTPTASGKTLCYNLPVLTTLMRDKEARALYLFPTKALSQDQQSELNAILEGTQLAVKATTYDGDTPSSLRISARETGRIIITNPDMLHSGILPNHPKWHRFFSNLKYVVIDETHIYRGLFGSHMANLLRRFRRILEFYGSTPVFIFCSATIGNPGSLASKLLGRPVKVIDNNGAPRSSRHLILFNPPLIDPVQGLRRSTVLEAQRLALLFLKEKIKTIVFARSRQRSELIASYLNQSLENLYTDNERTRVESYRGGYLPSERREVEKGLRDGTIMGVVSTNALELGIDIGGLDVSIMAGFPGTLASFWQQSGRAGRRSGESVSILIASNSPMDQFLVTNPSYIEKSSVEQAYIDPDNVFILMDHLKCSVFEKPFDEKENYFPESDAFFSHLESEGIVRLSGGKHYYSASGYPAESVSLRSAGAQNVVIINITDGKNEVIGEMDKPSAKEMLFPNAVYLHRGEQFLVEELDVENKQARVRESDVNYYTDSVVKSDIKVLTEEDRLSWCRLSVSIGDLLVRSQVSKFKKIKFHTHENLGYGEIFLPEEELHTRGLALIFDPAQSFGVSLSKSSDALKPKILFALGHMILNIAPLFLYCDRGDLAVSERIKDPHFQEPVLFIYEHCPGGCGLSEGLLNRLKDVLLAVKSRLQECPCTGGCPSCIGAVEASDVREGLKKIVRDIVCGALEGLE